MLGKKTSPIKEKRRYFRRLHIPKKQDHANNNLIDDVVNATNVGINFAYQYLIPFFQENANKELRKNLRLFKGKQGHKRLLRFSFLRGLAYAVETTTQHCASKSRSFMKHTRVLSQHELTRALLYLPQESRQILFEQQHRLNIGKNRHWRFIREFNGALAVARVAYALIDMGLPTYLPTIQEDRELTIDLLATVDTRRYGMCLQIKGTAKEQYTTYHVLPRKPDNESPFIDQDEALALWEGTEYFNHLHETRWTPVHILVGLDIPAKQWAVEECTLPYEMIRDLLETYYPDLPIFKDQDPHSAG
ncbi:MAG: hypothetical protein ABIH21_01975 [Patescibacteria group bacterium]